MKALLLLAVTTGFLTGCYSDNREYQAGDVMMEPAGAEVTAETWSDEQRDMNQRPYRRQFETERHQQFDSDTEFTHGRMD